MKSKPLLFKAEMIQALLRQIEKPGTGKTQTRRTKGLEHFNKSPDLYRVTNYRRDLGYPASEGEFWAGFLYQDGHPDARSIYGKCPYRGPGDLIWCKETYYAWGRWETRFNAKKGRDEKHFIDMTLECGHEYQYAAPAGYGSASRTGVFPTWWKRPSIFMPRVASRIALQITGVRVERLHDITEEDSRAEGCLPVVHDDGSVDCGTRKTTFYKLWQSINGPKSWDANPWVWVIEFNPILANVDAVLAAPEQFGIKKAA